MRRRRAWLVQIAEQHVPLASIAPLQKSDPEEWGRRSKSWAEGYDRSSPLLSDEAMSRQGIYPDRS
jgi:hypothetical protein